MIAPLGEIPGAAFFYTMKPSPYSVERKVFGFAMSHDPAEIFQAIQTKEPSHQPPELVGKVVADVIKEDMESSGQPITPSLEVIEDTLTFVATGVRDTYEILTNEFATISPPLTFERAMGIAQHPQTAQTIAALALRSADELEPLTSVYPGPSIYKLDASQRYIEPGKELQIPPNPISSCPFAGREGIVAPDPLFVRFVAWAGAISVQHYYDQSL